MRFRNLFALAVLPFSLMLTPVFAQSAEVTVTLDEKFFEAVLDAVFKDQDSLELPLNKEESKSGSRFSSDRLALLETSFGSCEEKVFLHRELKGKRTSVRLADGKILAPMAVSGIYDPPLLPCFDYSGIADTEITLDFDRDKQQLVGRVKVVNVNLSGTGGVGGGIVARIVQRSIDKKVNPIQILGLDRVSLMVPVQGAGDISMKAVEMTNEIGNGSISVKIRYEFTRVPASPASVSSQVVR